MKELSTHVRPTIEISKQKEIRKPLQHIGALIFYKGHKAYELNTKTGKIIEASFDDITCSITGKVTRKIITKPDCLYCVALNETNASRKLMSMIKPK